MTARQLESSTPPVSKDERLEAILLKYSFDTIEAVYEGNDEERTKVYLETIAAISAWHTARLRELDQTTLTSLLQAYEDCKEHDYCLKVEANKIEARMETYLDKEKL